MAVGKAFKLGPGTLKIGPTGTALDLSCSLSKAWLKWDSKKDDDTPMLCGDDIAGDTIYTAKLSGTVALDLSAQGMVDYTWTNKGTQQDFEFVPNSTAARTVTGVVTINPLDVGGDEVKKNMFVDFEWDCVGEPALDAGVALARAPLEPAYAGDL